MAQLRQPFVPLAILLSLVLATAVAGQQTAPPAPPAAEEKGETEAGIPIHDPVVRQACASCHRPDDKGQLSRISFQRRTPEGWQASIQRMAALNGLNIEPQAARQVVRYLSNHLGLAPEEARPAAFEAERRQIDYGYPADATTKDTCTACHTMGRVISQRRTAREWELTMAMHRGFYPLIDFQGFRRMGPAPRPGQDGSPPDLRHPVEKAVQHLQGAFPLKTAEWSAWSATMRPARLGGTWALSGWDPGRGAIYGTAVITPVEGTDDEVTTDVTFTYARGGDTVKRSGRAIVYTGFQWRGRSTVGADADSALREVMFVERDQRSIEGRWFTGGYDELGIDVTLRRADAATAVLGADITALRAGQTGQELTIYGANLPAALAPADVDLGPGVTIARVGAVTPTSAEVVVDVAADAPVGARDLFVAGASLVRAVAVYDSIDRIKVTPDWAMARVGGVVFPKMLAQFEAWGYDNGPDGQPDTPDDVALGLVPATWSLEEYAATYGDDDLEFVGAIDARTGLFTPNVDGPNTARSGSRNNIGDVWAVATFSPEGHTGAPLRARSHLLVTVPLYMRFDPTVGQ